jgi:hypothetical protein
MFIAYRIALALYIVFIALKAWKRRSPQALVFASAGFLLILNGQWGQASTLGAAMIVGGLSLAAASMGDKRVAVKAKSRKDRLSYRMKRNRLTNATT